jgi:hypothetical protein
MKKRIDECFMCKSRSCYKRVYRNEEPYFYEIACEDHEWHLDEFSDEILGKNNGVMRIYVSGSSIQKRNKINNN